MRPLNLIRLGILLCIAFALAPGYAADTEKFGKTLIATHEITGDVLSKMQAFQAKPRDPKLSPLENALAGATVDWIGPELSLAAKSSPFNVVIRLKAHANADGPASSMWQGGWRLTEDNTGPITRTTLIPGMAKTDAKAGQALELVGRTGPISFKTDRNAAPAVLLSRTENMSIDQITVEVWQGMEPTSAVSFFMSFKAVWLGLVLIGLWWFWFRR